VRWVLGIAVLLCMAIPQALFAQSPSIPVQASSSWQAKPPLQASSATPEAPTRAVGTQTVWLLNVPDFRNGSGRYALLEMNGENEEPASLAPSNRSASNKAASNLAFRPAIESRKPPVQLWRALLVVQHGAAVFDAWSTRDAIQNGGAHELNPLFRPFAGSNAIYAATQVGSGLFDYLGHRMMTSKKSWMRRWWWVPQVAGTIGSLFSGAHNLAISQGKPGGPTP
jgi:hypothetical protein